MSLILDALNRAEHERKNQNAVPDLNTLHRPQEFNTAPNTRQTLWLAMGVALVLIAMIITLVVLLRQKPVAQLATTNSAPSQQSPAVVSTNPVVVQTAPSAEPATASATTAIPVVETAPEVATPNADVKQLYAAKDTEPAVATDAGVNELYAAEAATTAASETIVDPFNPAGDETVATASLQEQAPPRTFDSIKNIPDFNALPWNMRQQIPTISYARHNYLANGVSSVVINNQTSGVGNIIGTGQFIVQEIFVDGVILKHGNAVFKLRALNGWINM
ncbi:general secretion pathway protein GspB [Cellvibrio sp.]